MKAQDVIKQLDVSGTSYNLSGGRLRVMDPTQLPGALRAEFDERGFFKSEKADAADLAAANATEVKADADATAKTARQDAEGAALEAAKAETAAVREVLPMGETEKEMTVMAFLNPSGDTSVPAHLESHDPKPQLVKPKVVRDSPIQETVEAEEPEKSARLSGHLPDGFPGKLAFEAAGFDTYAKVRAVRKSGEKVENVGDKTNEAVDAIFAGEGA